MSQRPPTDYLGYYYLGGQHNPLVLLVPLLPSPAANDGFKELQPSLKLLSLPTSALLLTSVAHTRFYLTGHPGSSVWYGDGVVKPDGVNQMYVDGHGAWTQFNTLTPHGNDSY